MHVGEKKPTEILNTTLLQMGYSLNLSLKKRSEEASTRVSMLATITGMSWMMIPYTSQSKTPKQKNENMPNDKSLADPLFHVLITCGKKAMVVQEPAARPKICISFIDLK
jgi:hypothetical protein